MLEEFLKDPEFVKLLGISAYTAHWGTLDRKLPRSVPDAATKPESISVQTGIKFLQIMQEYGFILVKKE